VVLGARSRSALLIALASFASGWWATGLEPFSTRATLVVVAAGLAAMVIGGATRGVAPTRTTPLRATAPWILIAGALTAWQLAAYLRHPRAEHPTLSSLADNVLDARPIRAVAFAAWMVTAGWLAGR
jgi:hypothetical protein